MDSFHLTTSQAEFLKLSYLAFDRLFRYLIANYVKQLQYRAFDLRNAGIKQGKTSPGLIVGTPVRFVGAAESKDLLTTLPVPHITIRGTKEGSAIAAAIENSLLRIMLREEEKRHG